MLVACLRSEGLQTPLPFLCSVETRNANSNRWAAKTKRASRRLVAVWAMLGRASSCLHNNELPRAYPSREHTRSAGTR